MSTLSIHPIEYLRLHLHYEEVRTGLLAPLGSLVKKVSESTAYTAILVTMVLIVALVVLALINLRQAGVTTASFNEALAINDALAEKPVSPLKVNPPIWR